MRKLAWVLLLIVPPAYAAPQTLGARSPHHELRLVRTAMPDSVGYDVEVIDLDRGKTVLNKHVDGKAGQPVDVSDAVNNQVIRVRIADTPHFFSATVNVLEGKTIVDEFRTWWLFEPHEVPVPPPPPAMYVPLPAPLDGNIPLRVGGDVKAPILVNRVEPIYTDEARKARISGIVIVEAIIDTNGRVRDVRILKPLPFGLDQAAVDAVKQWEFKPGTLNGVPVSVIFNLTVNFKLAEPPPPPQP